MILLRILDTNTNTAIKNIILYLKIEEAKELYDSIGTLLKGEKSIDHAHVNDISFKHEITVVLYDEQKIESLNERSKKIILNDM